MGTDRIKSRINALLAKTTDNGASKAEMESALKKANELMTEYFISEHDLKDPEIIEKCVLKSFDMTKSGFKLDYFYHSLSKLFDCEHYFNRYFKKITFFGHATDVELCGYFYQLITKSCLKEKDDYLKTKDAKLWKQHFGTKQVSASFIKGFLLEIAAKMREMYEERQSNIPESYSVMIVEKIDKVKSEFEALNFEITISKKRKLSGIENVFNAGLDKGKEFQLTQGIDLVNKESENILTYHE